MLNINPNIKLVVGLVLVAAVGGLNAVYVAEPMWKWIGSVVGVLGFLETFFTVPSAAAAKLRALAVKGAPTALTLAVFFVLIECKAGAVATPSGVATVACVIDDAIAGKSVSQIVLDCGGDVAQVIAILADPANYPKVQGTPAYAEAGRAKTALAVCK